MNKVNVASFNDLDKAEVVKNRLGEAGVHAEVYDESKLQRFWFMSEPLAGKKIRVDEHDFEKAKEILNALDAKEDALHFAVHCPECNSPRIEYPVATRKFVTPTLIEIFCTVTHVMDKQFYCEDCHHTWSPTIKMENKTDILGWPEKKAKPSQV